MTFETTESRRFIFPRQYGQTYPLIVRAEGIRLYDEHGREYIDGSSGAIAVVSVGHGRREIAETIARQAERMAYVHSAEFQNLPAEELAAAVARIAPGDLNRCVFYSGGSEANEAAVKLARNYHIVRGAPSKHLTIARRRSFHGATVMTLALGEVVGRRGHYAPWYPAVPRIVAPECYRCPLGLRYPDCDLACARQLEEKILEVGPESVSAFIAEPIVGAAAPGMTPPEGYYGTIRAICDKYEVVFIADEIITGFGRTGRQFGIEHWDVQPDIAVVGKGIASGYVPLSGMVISDRIAQAFWETSLPYVHGFTHQGHPVACAAGVATLKIIEREGLVVNAATQGAHLGRRLQEIAQRSPIVGDVRGKGLLYGLELVRHKDTRESFAKSLKVVERVFRAALEAGLVIYKGAGHPAAGDEFLVSPPLTVTREDIDDISARLEAALQVVQEQLAAA